MSTLPPLPNLEFFGLQIWAPLPQTNWTFSWNCVCARDTGHAFYSLKYIELRESDIRTVKEIATQTKRPVHTLRHNDCDCD